MIRLATLATAIALAPAPPALAVQPSDLELQVAHCLGIWMALNLSAAQDAQDDCAPDALPVFKPQCESDKAGTIASKRTADRLRDYLAARNLSVADGSIALAIKRGGIDYALSIGADHDCVRALNGAAPTKVCVPAAQDAIDRLNRCQKVIAALPF